MKILKPVAMQLRVEKLLLVISAIALVTLILSSFDTAKADNIIDEKLSCHGTEPFWQITVDTSSWVDGDGPMQRLVHSVDFSFAGAESEGISLTNKQLQTSVSANDQSIFSISSKSNSTTTEAESAKTLTAFIDFHSTGETACNNGMSDEEYPYSVQLRVGSSTLSGCCASGLYPARKH